MNIEIKIEEIKNYIIENTNLVVDERKDVVNRINVEYDKNITLDKRVMAYKDKNSNYKYRFLLECYLKNGKNKKALFIMKNPSMADENWSDNTVNRVLETMHNFQYSKVYIMNLIPEYSPKPCNIHFEYHYEDILYINDEIIKILSSNVSRAFVAWGGNKSHEIPWDLYKARIEAMRIKLQKVIEKDEVFCYCYNKDKTPRHPGRVRWWNTEMPENEYKKWPLNA